MFNRTHSRTILMGCAAACALATSANAQVSDDQASQLEEVIVTAQLRAQDPIEVPFALTAYSGEFLDGLGVQDFEELSAFVPGLLVQNQSPNNPGFVIRGLTSDSTGASDEPRVSIYQDGVSISRAPGAFVELFDVDRVEVSKGPQSTLYGRGALIGAINVIQTKADLDGFAAEGRAAIGNYDYRMVELMLNAPVGDTAAFRFATRMKTRDGYVENLLDGRDYNGVDTQAFRALAAFEPTDALRVDVIANYQQDTPSGVSFRSIYYNPQDPNTGAVLSTDRDPGSPAALTPGSNIPGGSELGIDREVWGVTGLVRYDLSDSLTLNSVSAYRTFETAETFDPDGISLPILTGIGISDGEQWSQELRVNWDNGGALSGFVGASYFREENQSSSPIEIDERLALAQLAGILDGTPLAVLPTALPRSVYASQAFLQPLLAGLGIPTAARAGIANNLKASHIETAATDTELQSFDVFGDLTWKPTDRLEFAAGVRYTSDEKTTAFGSSVLNGRSIAGGLLALQQVQGQINALIAVGTPAALAQAAGLGAFANGLVIQLATPGAANAPVSAAFPLFGLTFQPTAGNGNVTARDLKDDGLTYRLTGRYAVSDEASLYATYARGRRPAVLAVTVPSTPFGAPIFTEVPAETVDSYEAGFKSALMDRRVRLDGAVYFYSYENFQTTEQVGTQFITTNAGEAEAYGFEGQASWMASDWLDLFATYGYNHARFQTGAREGNRLRLSPDHRVSIGALVTLPVTGGAFEIQPTYSWQSEVFFDDNNDRTDLQTTGFVPDRIVDEFQDSYGLVNLRVRYVPDGANWSVEAFGDNLLDETFIKDAGNTGDSLGLPTFIAGEPRTYGATVSVRY
ncbi:MAG: TonB-dependent receptor [Brevundimonas subvibrioides]|uniref:TonB-dependent receptor n=1 Tax=Brevundimonas subvibrioides TaxID=74313 RepID=A0A258HPF0_9CAUL|nr:TonB-dependent receptor [Brevundimonas subvibrioides]OYX58870.1 MAG: TonB-dependent receptor [Brevundimonas subvibrioides]